MDIGTGNATYAVVACQADVELRQSLRAATEEKNEAHFLENVQKLMTEDRSVRVRVRVSRNS